MKGRVVNSISIGKRVNFALLSAFFVGALLICGLIGCQPKFPSITPDDADVTDSTADSIGYLSADEEAVEILPKTDSGTRGQDSRERSVVGIANREVLPEMGKATGSYHLLSIGIDQYLDWPQLHTAVNGAKEVASVLTNQYAFFEPGNVRLLLDNEATEGNILAELRDLANKDRVAPEDSVIIYYAGHGHLDDLTDEGSWVPWESDTRNPESWISNARIKTIIAAMPARHVFLVSDSCFSGDFFRGQRNRGIEIVKNEQVRDEYLLRSRTAITSGSMEPVSDGGADGQSVFTYFFLKALRQIREPYVMSHDLFERVRRGVEVNAEQRPQIGILSGTNGEQGLFVLFRKGDKIIDQQLIEMRERNNRLEAQMSRVEQEREENARRQAEKEAELASLQAEIDAKSKEMANVGTGAAGSDEFSELLAYHTQLNTVRRNQADQLRKLQDREEKLKAEQARIVRERRQKELAEAKAAFDSDYLAFTNFLADPFTQEAAKGVVWQAIAKKYGVAEDQIDVNPGELEWDGEKVVLKNSGLRIVGNKGDFTIEGLEIAMVKIEPGKFIMGSPGDEAGRDDDENQHRVTLTDVYWLGKYEVTQGQWESVMGSNPSHFKNAGKQAPVENVSWEDTQEFIKKLNARERAAGRLPKGYAYGLPTEAQWEYACRAGTTKATYSRDPWKILGAHNAPSLDAIAWYGGNSGVSYSGAYDSSAWSEKQYNHTQAGIHPVGEKQPNAFGLYDILGNVFEWCEDWYGDYSTGPVTNPSVPTSGSARVVRGGSWALDARSCRSAFRYRGTPSNRINYVGFRLALSSALVR